MGYLSNTARRTLGLWVMSCVTAWAGAQDLESLPDLMAHAVATHPDIQVRRAEVKASQSGLEAARWGRYPSLTANLESSSGGPTRVLRLEQPLWTGGLITGQIDLAQVRERVAQAALRETQQRILSELATAYLEVLRLEARLKVAQSNEAEHQRLYNIIERRADAEVSPRTDAVQAGVRLNQALNERLQIQRQLQSVRYTVSQLIGRPVGELAPAPVLDAARWSEESLLRMALEFSPERARLQAEQEAADVEIELAKAQIKPKLVLGYVGQASPATGSSTQGRAYLALQVQSGAGLSSLSAVDAAVARREAAREAIGAHERQLTQQVRTGWADAQALLGQIEPVRALAAGSAEIVDSYLRQFQVGRKNWLDVLNAQRERTQAQYAITDLEVPLQQTIVRLLLLAGQINAQQTQVPHVTQ